VNTERMSFNQMTADQLSLAEAAALCADAGIRWFGPWRHKVAVVGAAEARRILDGHGLRVSSLCRGGFFLAAGEAEDNRRAVEEAATLGTDVLVLVCGPPEGADVDGARARIADGIERLLPFAADHGVRLAIEPLHPMMISERSAIVTLGEANDLAERFDEHRVGVIVDAYHVWWDPRLFEEIARAGRRILGYHVADWLVPTTDRLQGRGMMGDGVIDFPPRYRAVAAAGYADDIEVEIFNADIWAADPDEVVATMVQRYIDLVL
jgi:sugar phosphate isomerase/epimerase